MKTALSNCRQTKIHIICGNKPLLVFSATGASKKHLIGENPLNLADFQEHRGGIGGDRVQSENL